MYLLTYIVFTSNQSHLCIINKINICTYNLFSFFTTLRISKALVLLKMNRLEVGCRILFCAVIIFKVALLIFRSS